MQVHGSAGRPRDVNVHPVPGRVPGNHVHDNAQNAPVFPDEKTSMSRQLFSATVVSGEMHGDDGVKSKTRRKSLPAGKRVTIELCEVGDIAELPDGRRCIVTGRINGGPFGRWLSPEGVEGEFVPISGALACRVVGRP